MTAVTIAGQVAAMAETPAGQPPEEAMGVFAREQAELAAGGIPDGVIASGALLPDADLFDPLGAPAIFHDAIGDQRAVVVLYRGAWCPYCNITVRTCQSELRAIALELAAVGARVALLARSAEELDQVAGTVRDRGGIAGVFPADAADPAQADGALTRIAAELGRVGIVISNAAVVWPLGPTVTVTPAEWSAAFAVNVGAVFQLSAALLLSMLEQGWGRIVNISSGIAANPAGMIGGNAYATTKAALEAHTINLAAELAGSGVTASIYRPGSVDTAMQAWIRARPPAKIGAALHERFARSYEEGSLSTPGQSARSLMQHLATDATGEIWNVNTSRPEE